MIPFLNDRLEHKHHYKPNQHKTFSAARVFRLLRDYFGELELHVTEVLKKSLNAYPCFFW